MNQSVRKVPGSRIRRDNEDGEGPCFVHEGFVPKEEAKIGGPFWG